MANNLHTPLTEGTWSQTINRIPVGTLVALHCLQQCRAASRMYTVSSSQSNSVQTRPTGVGAPDVAHQQARCAAHLTHQTAQNSTGPDTLFLQALTRRSWMQRVRTQSCTMHTQLGQICMLATVKQPTQNSYDRRRDPSCIHFLLVGQTPGLGPSVLLLPAVRLNMRHSGVAIGTQMYPTYHSHG
jgi:hypothetical protein